MSLYKALNSIENVAAAIDNVVRPVTPVFTQTPTLSGAPVSLGDFDFDEFDVPEDIDTTVVQNHTTTRLMGGRYVTEAHGAEHEPIRWSGWLIGPDAADRKRHLESFAFGAKKQTLCWGEFDYDVLVGRVTVRDEHPFKKSYSIEVSVLDTNRPSGVTTSAMQEVQGKVAGAVGILPSSESSVGSTLNAVTGTLAKAQSVARVAGDFIQTVETARDTVVSRLGSANALIRNIGSIGQIGSTTSTISALNQAKNAFEDIYRLGNASSYLVGAVRRAAELKFG